MPGKNILPRNKIPLPVFEFMPVTDIFEP